MLADAKVMRGDLDEAKALCTDLVALGHETDSARATALGDQALSVVTGCLLDREHAGTLAHEGAVAARDPLDEGCRR